MSRPNGGRIRNRYSGGRFIDLDFAQRARARIGQRIVLEIEAIPRDLAKHACVEVAARVRLHVC